MSELFAVPKITSYWKPLLKLPTELTETLATFLAFTSVLSLCPVRTT